MPDHATHAVFLSYAHEDTEAVRGIADALRSHGVEAWFDQSELRGGDVWDQKIRRQIKECALFVPVISAHTNARAEGYFRREWRLAVERMHDLADDEPFLVPVVIDDTSDAAARVPDRFRESQWSRLPGGQPTLAFCEQMKKLLAHDSAAGETQATEGSAKRADPGAVAGMPSSAGARPAPPTRTPSKLAWAAIAAVIAVAAAVAIVALRPNARNPPAPAAAAKPPLDLANAKSIAVLPFTNMSEDKEASAFFTDGMHEDVLTHLSNIHELKVVSRTTAMQYRDTKKSMRQIGQELHVAFLLEGSVRRVGSKVRITGQLINAATDEHLWAKSYDRDLTDIFAIQAELAKAIAAELRAAISPQEKTHLERRPTENLAAYDLFLQARAIHNLPRPGSGSRTEQVQLLEKAVSLDPNFVAAWTALAIQESRGAMGAGSSQAQRARAKAAVDATVRLAPDSPDAVLALGEYYYRCETDFPRALDQFEKFKRLRPDDPYGSASAAAVLRQQGKWAESLANFRHAGELDPGDLRNAFDLTNLLAASGRFAEARAESRRIIEKRPDDWTERFTLAYLAFLADGATGEVEEFFRRLPADLASSPQWISTRIVWAIRHGDLAEAVRLDRERSGPFGLQWDLEMAVVFAAQGDVTAARARLPMTILRSDVERSPESAGAWARLGRAEALLGNNDEALRCARRALEVPRNLANVMSAGDGPLGSLAFVQAWTGQKDAAIASYARLLQTPNGDLRNPAFSSSHPDLVSIHVMKRDPRYAPLRGDPRFEALLNDPKNHAPLF